MQQALRTKLLIGILAALTALGVLLAHQLRTLVHYLTLAARSE